jgi:DNA-binding MarR family transcriptional regulator
MRTDDGADSQPVRRLLTLDRTVHEPARLAVLVLLAAVEEADFLYLLDETGLSRGNLSSHASKLEQAGYISVDKLFVDKMPRTVYRLTEAGSAALADYRRTLGECIVGEFHPPRSQPG